MSTFITKSYKNLPFRCILLNRNEICLDRNTSKYARPTTNPEKFLKKSTVPHKTNHMLSDM